MNNANASISVKGRVYSPNDRPTECNISDTNARQQSFEEAARPLIKWLAENVHPHHSVIVTSTHAELLMGEMVLSTDEYLKD